MNMQVCFCLIPIKYLFDCIMPDCLHKVSLYTQHFCLKINGLENDVFTILSLAYNHSCFNDRHFSYQHLQRSFSRDYIRQVSGTLIAKSGFTDQLLFLYYPIYIYLYLYFAYLQVYVPSVYSKIQLLA